MSDKQFTSLKRSLAGMTLTLGGILLKGTVGFLMCLLGLWLVGGKEFLVWLIHEDEKKEGQEPEENPPEQH